MKVRGFQASFNQGSYDWLSQSSRRFPLSSFEISLSLSRGSRSDSR